AVAIDPPAAVVLEVLLELVRGRFAVGESVDHARAVDRVLLEPVHDLRRLDAKNLIDRRHHVVDVMELRTWRRIGLDALGQERTSGLRVPPKCEAMSFE